MIWVSHLLGHVRQKHTYDLSLQILLQNVSHDSGASWVGVESEVDERRQVSCSGLVTREDGRRPRRVRERIGVAATHGSAGRHLPDATWGCQDSRAPLSTDSH